MTIPLPAPVLLVEDNPADVYLFKELSGVPVDRIVVANDGCEALDHVLGNCGLPLEPALVILDLNLPKLDAQFVLNVLNSVPLLRRIRVVVLTSSQSRRDVQSCAAAYGYFVKPPDLDAYQELAEKLAQIWRECSGRQEASTDSLFGAGAASWLDEAGRLGVFGDSEWAQEVSYHARHDLQELIRGARISMQIRRRRPETASDIKTAVAFSTWPRVRANIDVFLGGYVNQMRPACIFRSLPFRGLCSQAVQDRIDELWTAEMEERGVLARASAAVCLVDQTLNRWGAASASDPLWYEVVAGVLDLEDAINDLPLRIFLPALAKSWSR